MGEARERLRQIYQQEEQGQKTLIPARPKRSLNKEDQFFRVCAYCRVSTDNEEQLSSYELQQAHYRKVAESHPNWDLRRIYADEGISATSMKNRDEFNEMIGACERGEYEIFLRTLIQFHAHKSIENRLKQRLSADFRWSAESLAFYGLKLISDCDNRLNPLWSQNKNVYEK